MTICNSPCGRKGEDLSPDYPDPAVVRRVELQHHRVELFGRVQLLRTREDGAGLPGARGSVEQQMGQLILPGKYSC